MAATDILERGERELALRGGQLNRYRQHWMGNAPAAFLSRDARAALDSSLTRLGVNFPRLAVNALSERLTLQGFGYDDGDDQTNTRGNAAWLAFTGARGRQAAALAAVDRLLYGASYVTVWGRPDDGGTQRPVVSSDTPLTMWADTCPETGDVLAAVRRVNRLDGGAIAVVYERDKITRFEQDGYGSLWRESGVTDNALRTVPVVPFTRRGSAADGDMGQSAVTDILDLTDAVSKLLADAMVGSEYFARPRRWATGLEIEEDDDGNPVDPFGESRLLQSEDPDTKFGQLEAGRLDGYSDMVAMLTQQIGSLTGLPPHYLGLHGDQPPSSEAVRAAETQLTTRAYAEQVGMSPSWARVAWLVDAVRRVTIPDPAELHRWTVAWTNPETRTPAQAADAAGKLRTMGLPLETVLTGTLGYAPDEAKAIAKRAQVDAALNAFGGQP